MTRSFIHLPDSVGVTGLEHGGTFVATGDEVYVPAQLGIPPDETGITAGPILLETPPGGVVPLESLTFLPDDEDGGFLGVAAVGAAGAGAADRGTDLERPTIDTPPLSRRSVLAVFVAALAAAVVTDAAAADDDELVTLNIATLELGEPTAPVTVSVVDAVDGVLPPSAEILIDQRSARVGKIVDNGEGVTLRQTAGEVRIYVRDTLGRIARVLAWARSFLPSDMSVSYRQPFPDDRQASDYDTDEFVRLTDHPAIIAPIEASDDDRTLLEIGDEYVPHADDGANAVGAWSLLDGTLIYEVGPDPPDADEWEVTTRLSTWQSIRHRHL